MRILKHAALNFSCLIAFSCFAQKEIVRIDFPYRSIQNFDFSKNQIGDYCLFVNKEEFYYFCYISKEGEKIYDTTIRVTESTKSFFLGVKPFANQFLYCFLPIYSKNRLNTICITKEKSNCSKQANFDFTSVKGERIITGIKIDSNFQIVSASKKTSSLYISTITGNFSVDKKVYPLTVNEKITKKYITVTSSRVIHKLFSTLFFQSSYEMLNQSYMQISNDKIYIDNSNIHFTFNEGEIISILQDSSKLYFNYFYEDLPFNNVTDFSSFPLGDHLFRVIVTSKEFFLKIYTLNDGKLIKEFHYTNKDKFDLIYAPYIKYLITPKNNDVKDMKPTVKELFKDLSRGNLNLYAIHGKNNNLHLFIGSTIADPTFSVPLFIPSATPTTLILPIATFNSPTGNYVFTETILSTPNYDIIPFQESSDYYISDKVKIWPDLKNQDSTSNKLKFSESNEYLYVLQLFKDKKQLVITEFEK